MPRRKIDKGVIVAAGDGQRMGPLTRAHPKALLSLSNQEPLITRPIQALVAAGIREIAIVVGHFGDKIMQSLGDGDRFGAKLRYIVNSDYLGGNATSVSKAEEWTRGDPVVLCMGDHLIEDRLVSHLLGNHTLDDTLCVDYVPGQHHKIDEATKVVVDFTGLIKNISKELINWDALDTGVFLLTGRFFQATRELIHDQGINIEIADVLRFLIGKGPGFRTCNVSGCFWMDVDTEEDLNLARLLGQRWQTSTVATFPGT